jgi:transcriptional regulator with XRE-family HTH domain
MSLTEGRLIRQARKRSGYTQIDLAEKIGISFQPINRIENGFESVSLHNLRLICEAIGLEVIIQQKNG